jgi:membrane protease subunit (stomatin/prohibitin family)
MSEVINVIKYEGDKSTFIWKHSCTNYKIDSQLIVPVSQKAIFFADGQALDIFGPGTHILQTQNIPLISNYFSLTAEHKKTNFQCELYFINKSQEMVMKCDTGCRAEYFEPMFQFPLTIGVKGQMSISVNNSVKLITKLRDTDTGLERIRLLEYFRSFLISKLITVLSQTLKNDKINIFEIDKELDVFSEKLKIKLMDIFSDNGLLLNQFFITEFVIPEDHINYKEYKKQYFEKCSDIQLDDLDKELEIKPDKASQDQQLEKYNEYEQMLREKQVLEAKINLLKQAIKLRKYDKYEEKLKKKN